jgi:hypothetical protein
MSECSRATASRPGVSEPRPRPGASGPRARALIAALSLTVSMGACTSSAPHTDTSPLSTGASAPPLYCAFVSKRSADTASGGLLRTFAEGSPVYAQGAQRNADGGRLVRAACTLEGFPRRGPGVDTALAVDVAAIGERPDLDQLVVNQTEHTHGYRFPADFGIGFAALRYPNDKSKGAFADLLRGNWHVTVSIPSPAAGRDSVKDATAIARQVIAFLRLPATHAEPYPTPSSSS